MDDLRHKEVLPADLEDVRKLEIELDGEKCVLTTKPEDDELRWEYKSEKVDGYNLEDALRGLRVTDLGKFSTASWRRLSSYGWSQKRRRKLSCTAMTEIPAW